MYKEEIMLKIFETLINLLAVLAIATFALTLFCQRLSKKSNWQTSRIISNSYLIVYELIYITIHYFSNKSFSKDPAFTPILIGMFFSLHLSTTAFTLSSAPIFPGLILILSTPAFIAFIASK